MDCSLIYKHYQFAYNLTKNKMDADDLIQDFIIKTLDAGVKEINSSYIKTGLKFIFLDKKKFYERRAETDLDIVLLESEIQIEIAEQICTDEKLIDIIHTLNKRTNLTDVLILHYFFGLKCREIAEKMNLNINTVIGKLRYGRDNIKTILSK